VDDGSLTSRAMAWTRSPFLSLACTVNVVVETVVSSSDVPGVPDVPAVQPQQSSGASSTWGRRDGRSVSVFKSMF